MSASVSELPPYEKLTISEMLALCFNLNMLIWAPELLQSSEQGIVMKVETLSAGEMNEESVKIDVGLDISLASRLEWGKSREKFW